MTSRASSLVVSPKSGCPDPLHRSIAFDFRERFFPLGTSVEIQSNQEVVLEAARSSFSRYGGSPQGHQPEFLIQLCVDPERHDDRSRAVPCYRALSHLFHIGCSDASFAIADLAKGCAIGFVSSEIAHDTSFFRYVFLECLFHVLVVHRSHTPVHCSCVALDGRGVLICGPSGTGKTTLAYACARAGMQIVADDVVHLRLDSSSRQLALWGNPWTLRLLPDAVQIFPELIGTEIKRRSDHEGYLEVDVSRQLPGRALVSCLPTGLVFLERDDGANDQIHPIERDLALRRLRQDVILDEEPVIARHQRVLQELVTAGVYELSYAGSPSVAVELIKGLLQQ